MKTSGLYSAIIWAGGYSGSAPHSYSDIDLYAISSRQLSHHWYMERVNGKRVELTVYKVEAWRELLSKQYRHPMHHYTFANGQILHDPRDQVPELRTLAQTVLKNWKPSEAMIAELRKNLTIGIDKFRGYIERGDDLQIHFHSIAMVHGITELLAHYFDGYALVGGKNLERVLSNPKFPSDACESIKELLRETDPKRQPEIALRAAYETLRATGGDVTSYNGGIPV